jgi:UDP-N-acetylglucosamine 2-epimerase (non-hydrolysing)
MTIHRPATVDSKEGLEKLIRVINNITAKYKIVFPIHPRTVKNMRQFNLYDSLSKNSNLILSEPLDYFSFQKLIKDSLFVLTDSGGVQEETSFLQVPCLTLRANTERPVTVEIGTNELLPFDERIIEQKISLIENNTYKKGKVPPLWDGKATERIIDILKTIIS